MAGSLLLHGGVWVVLGSATPWVPWGSPRAGTEPSRPAWQLRWAAPEPSAQARALVGQATAPNSPVPPGAAATGDTVPPPGPEPAPAVQGSTPAAARLGEPDGGSPAARQAVPPGAPRPVLPTQIPREFEQVLQVRRGGQWGQGTWSWAVQHGRYRSELRAALRSPSGAGSGAGAAAAAAALNWASTGGLDEHGVAPDRFLSRPAKGGARAVNFQRDSGVVSYSGPTGQAGLVPGAQDRLSWLVQLLALAQAHPIGQGLPARLPLWVAGPQGDGADWWFEVQWHAAQRCWQFTRRPERRYEVQVQAWVAVQADEQGAHLVHLEMGHEGSRQPPWQLWDAAQPGRCGHTP